MKIFKIFGLLAILTIAACAHTENSDTYHKAAGTGFSFQPIGDQNYRVFFKGERNQSNEAVRYNMIEGAAALTKSMGFDYFYLTDENTGHKKFSDIGVSDGVGQLLAIVAVGLFNAKNYDSENPYSTQLPYPKSRDVEAVEFDIYVSSGVIKMGKGNTPPGAFTARF